LLDNFKLCKASKKQKRATEATEATEDTEDDPISSIEGNFIIKCIYDCS
jgi:hypothetical protein